MEASINFLFRAIFFNFTRQQKKDEEEEQEYKISRLKFIDNKRCAWAPKRTRKISKLYNDDDNGQQLPNITKIQQYAKTQNDGRIGNFSFPSFSNQKYSRKTATTTL